MRRRRSSSSASASASSPSKSPPLRGPAKSSPVRTPGKSRRTWPSSSYSSPSSSESKSPQVKRRTKKPRTQKSTTGEKGAKKVPLEKRNAANSQSQSSSSAYSSSASSPESKSLPVKRRAKRPQTKKSLLGEKGAKKVPVEKRLHSVLLCRHEINEAQLLTSFKSKRLIKYSRPIGHVIALDHSTTTKRKSYRVPELQSLGCSVLKAIEKLIRLLHKKKYTLGGKLNIKMLYWIPSSKCVKLHKDTIEDLKKYSDEGAKLDYSSIGISIRDGIFGAKDLELPADVVAWIDLMISDPLKNKHLLKYNIALLHRREKMDLFLAYYEKLLQLKNSAKADKEKKNLVDQVVNNINMGKYPYYVWLQSVEGNTYVNKFYTDRREGRNESIFELLRFTRDCIHHLIEYSVENKVVLFGVGDKYLMLETCFPGIFHKFQKAMVDAGFKESEYDL